MVTSREVVMKIGQDLSLENSSQIGNSIILAEFPTSKSVTILHGVDSQQLNHHFVSGCFLLFRRPPTAPPLGSEDVLPLQLWEGFFCIKSLQS